jgi:hypothetical protein
MWQDAEDGAVQFLLLLFHGDLPYGYSMYCSDSLSCGLLIRQYLGPILLLNRFVALRRRTKCTMKKHEF